MELFSHEGVLAGFAHPRHLGRASTQSTFYMRVDRQRYPDRRLPATQLSGAWKKNHMRLLSRGTNIGTLSYSNT